MLHLFCVRIPFPLNKKTTIRFLIQPKNTNNIKHNFEFFFS